MNIKHVSAMIDQGDGGKTRRTWICTRCTSKDVVRNHMCHDCEREHNAWLRELSRKKCTYCEKPSKYQKESYNLCQSCADNVNNLILGDAKSDNDQWYTLYESEGDKG